MLKPAFIFLAILWVTVCCAQGDMTFISNWKSYPAPVSAATNNTVSRVPSNWWVYLKDGVVRVSDKNISPQLPFKVSLANNKSAGISFLKVSDGYLVGLHNNWSGGSLHWFSADGRRNYKISNDEIVQFVNLNGKSYAIENSARPDMPEGSIISIKKNNGRWVAKAYLQSPNTPCAITTDAENNLLLITTKSLFSIDSTATIHTLINRGLWWNHFRPTSIVVKDTLIYAGMLGGVYQYNSYSGEKTWLMNH